MSDNDMVGNEVTRRTSLAYDLNQKSGDPASAPKTHVKEQRCQNANERRCLQTSQVTTRGTPAAKPKRTGMKQ